MCKVIKHDLALGIQRRIAANVVTLFESLVGVLLPIELEFYSVIGLVICLPVVAINLVEEEMENDSTMGRKVLEGP